MLAYRTGQYVTNSSSEEDKEAIELIQAAGEEVRKLAMINSTDKNFYHYLGLQGFKRYHRFEAREYFEFSMCLDCLLIDHYGIEPMYKDIAFIPSKKTAIMERMQEFINALEEILDKMNHVKSRLVELKHHYAAEYIQKIINENENDLKHAYRCFNYAKDVGGQLKDLHSLSERIHDEYECKEKECHNR